MSSLDDPRLSAEVLEVDVVGGPLSAVVHLPGSKSITNRALVCAALADGPSVLRGALWSDDTDAMVGGLVALGVEVDRPAAAGAYAGVAAQGRCGWTLWGRGRQLTDRTVTIDARLSGTTSRFLLPLAALAPGRITLDGHQPLRARPMGDGLAAVADLGATVEAAGDRLPVVFDGPAGEGGSVTVRGDVSSQFLSGLLLSGPVWREGLEVRVDGPLQSAPYVEMTLAVMAAFGAQVDVLDDGRTFAIAPTGYQARTFEIEPDASTASYAFAAAALCGGTVTVAGLGADSLQGDVAFVDVLEAYGAQVHRSEDSISVTGTGRLVGGHFDMSQISDTAQTLAALAPFAEAPTEIGGIGFIRRKETDRIGAVVAELTRLGVRAVELEDGFRIEPNDGPWEARMQPGTVATYDDHRMAMSFALGGLRVPGILIADPGCVTKTFPGYWALLDELRTSATEPDEGTERG